MTKRLEEENKENVNNKSLITPMLELDYLITPQNVSKERIFKLLKQTEHSFFSNLEIADDGDLTFAVDCYIQIL